MTPRRIYSSVDSLRPVGGAFPRVLLLLACAAPLGCEEQRLPETPPSATTPHPTGDPEAFLHLSNLGRAHYENKRSADAIAALTRAMALRPDSATTRTHLALAYLLARMTDAALTELNEAARLAPDSVAVAYLTGVAYLRSAQYAQATPHLERAARDDPNTPAVHYQLGAAHLGARRFEPARAEFQRVVQLDPRHASAHHQLMLLARRAGDVAEAERRLQMFMQLREVIPESQRTPDALERCRYTKMQTAGVLPDAPPAVRVQFTDVTEAWLPDALRTRTEPDPTPSPTGAVALIDLEDDGRWELLVTDANGRLRLLAWTDDARLTDVTETVSLRADVRATAARVGDYNNDGADDIFILSRTRSWLLARQPDAGFADVTDTAGLGSAAGTDAIWLDYDHDGDLDLLVVGESTTGVGLYQNRSDGTFQPAPDAALTAEQLSALRAAAADDEADDDLDIYLAASDGVRVLRNIGQGSFTSLDPLGGNLGAVRALAVEDLDHDGHIDVVAATSDRVWVITAAGRRYGLEPAIANADDILLFDYDNDGWTDILATTRGDSPDEAPLRLWRNRGEQGFDDVTDDVSMPDGPFSVLSAAACDLDNDGDSDLLLATNRGPVLLRNDGGNANGQLKIRLTGLKTNRTGLGTTVEVRAGGFRASRTVGSIPVELGIADHTTLDSVRVVWTNGIVQHDVNVTIEPGRLHRIQEKNVAAGSCPFLYVWDGQSFRFVTDLLGTSPMGLSATRGTFLPADADELVKIGPADALPARNGRHVVMITDEMREVVYLDRLALLAVDRRADQEVHATDKLMMPPFPASEVWWLTDPRAPERAHNERGDDVTAALRAIDGQRVGPTQRHDGQFRGMAFPAHLTLDFGSVDALDRPVLVLTGWIQYGDASVNVANGQRKNRLGHFPQLEVRRPDGSWRPLPVTVGVPAGKTKTILCDLSNALGAHRGQLVLRLSSGLELYWDRIALMSRSNQEGVNHRVDVHEATLQFRGFSQRRKPTDDAPEVPDPSRIEPAPPWRRVLTGACTRYGDVTELLHQADNRTVILNSGDALVVEFRADTLPPPRDGMVREFFLYSVGWDKDGDYNVAASQTVDPLPFHGMDDNRYGLEPFPWTTALREWAKRYNTRWVGRDAFTLRTSPTGR